MIKRFKHGFGAWRQKRSLTFMLMTGFVLVTFLAIFSTLGVIGTMMRARMFRSSDRDLSDRVRIMQALIQSHESFLARQAMSLANLEGLTAALAKKDAAQVKRILIPAVVAQKMDSVYVILPDRQVLLYIGDVMGERAEVANLSIVENGFDLLPSTSPIRMPGALWLAAAAPHRTLDGNIDGVILIGRQLDAEYLQSLSRIMGTQVALTFEDIGVYSFSPPPIELPLIHLRAAHSEGVEYLKDEMAFHSMDINAQPYRVVASDIPMRNAGALGGYLFQPIAPLFNSMREAVSQVLGIGLGILLLGSIFAYIYAQTVTRPLQQLTRATQATARGDFSQSLAIKGQDEVGQLARTFETMRAEIAKMLQTQQQWNSQLEERVRAKTAELQTMVEERNYLLNQMISTQEEERRRIARELHDETSQSLTALIATVGAAQAQSPEQAQARIGELRSLLVRTLQEVNRIVLDLRPALLDDLGLVPALEWYAGKRLGNTDTEVEVSTQGDPVRLPPSIETILFRIGQEAITNAAKYAQAAHVSVHILFENADSIPEVTLIVQDDGCGFDAADIRRDPNDGRQRLGLLGIQERVQLVGGQLQIHSVIGEGTTITATVPLQAPGKLEGAPD